MAIYTLTPQQLKGAGIYNSFEIPAGGGTPPFSNTKSILLDGVDDYVDCGDNDNLSFGNGTTDSPFSISAWVKMTDATRFRIVFKADNTTGNNEYGFFCDASDRINFILYDSTLSVSRGRYYNVGLSSYQGQWINLVATYDGQGGTSAQNGIKIYLNGTQVDNVDVSTGTYTAMHNGNAPLEIGKFLTNRSNGLMDEIAIFNVELSASDVTSIYGGGVPSSLSSYSSLVSWWRCGDGDTAPILSDNGSGGNDGTMTNFSTFSTDVPSASSFTNTKSIQLDGVDDYVDCGNPTSLQITGKLTISAWVKTTNTSTTSIIVGKDGVSPYSTRSYQIQLASTGEAKFVIFKSGSVIELVIGTTLVNDGNWHHVMGVNDGTDLKIYVDGTLEGTNIGSGGAIQNGTANLNIGRRQGNGANELEFLGKIDEVAVWNSDQSANVSTIYNGGMPNDISSLSPLSWWRCGDGDTAPRLTDNGSASNDGTMTNFTTFSTDVPT